MIHPRLALRPAQVLLTLGLLLRTSAALAQWDPDGNEVTSVAGALDFPGHDPNYTVGTSVCTDGNGGLICAVKSGPLLGPTWEIRIQRLDWNGDKAWSPSDGISVNGGSTATGPPHVVSDGGGGAWVVWADNRVGAPGLYAQRFDHAGNMALSAYPSGKRISGVEYLGEGDDDVDVDATPSGKLIVAYWTTLGPRINRFNWSGATEIGALGLGVSTDAGPHRLDVTADGEGAVVAWESARAGQAGATSIFANRMSAAAAVTWGAEGALVYSAATVTPAHTRAAWEGSDLFVTWSIGLGVRAQRVNSSGVALWGTTIGAVVRGAISSPWDVSGDALPQIVGDGAGGCVIVWQDLRDYDRLYMGAYHREDVYAQRVASNGAMLWTANGAPVDTLVGRQYFPQPTSDGAGGAIVAFTDYYDVDLDVTLRAIDGTGAVAWSHTLTGTSGDNGTQDYAVIASDNAGGALVAWWDARSGAVDCWAAHRAAGGGTFDGTVRVEAPNGGEFYLASQVVPITWECNVSASVRIEYSVAGGPRSLITAGTPNDGSFDWTAPVLSSSQVRVFVSSAVDATPEDQSDADFTICAGFALPGATHYAIGTYPVRTLTGDFDEDGVPDLALLQGAPADSVSILLGNDTAGIPNGTFAAPVRFAVGASTQSFASGDFDEDGILDLAIGVIGGVRLLAGMGSGGMGNGTFAPPTGTISIPGAYPAGICAADFNEDGILDLATGNWLVASVAILLGNGTAGVGNGTFAAPVFYAVGTNPGHLVAADFDGDDRLDLAVSDEVAGTGAVRFLTGDGAFGVGDGTFSPHSGYAVGMLPRGLATGDFNEDGLPDIVVANRNSNSISVLLGGGPGPFGPQFTLAGPIATGLAPIDVAVADVTGDGVADLVASCSNSDRLDLLVGIGAGGVGSGAFGLAASYAVGNSPQSVIASDFNADGTSDLAAGNALDSNVSVLLGGCGGASGAIAVVTPNGGEAWPVGSTRVIAWTAGEAVQAVDVEISHDGGVTWETVASRLTGGAYAWHVTAPTTTTARVRVRDADVSGRFDTGDAVFALTDDGVTAADDGAPRSASLGAPSPNPSIGVVRLSLAQPRAGRIEAAVFDVSGRCVRVLERGPSPAGARSLVWDGRGADGVRVAGGLYFVRVNGEGFAATRRLIRLR